MFHKGRLGSYDAVKQVGTIHLLDKDIQLHFLRKDFPNLTLEPQIGERVKCLIEEIENKYIAKFIVRLDHKNARTELPLNDIFYKDQQALLVQKTCLTEYKQFQQHRDGVQEIVLSHQPELACEDLADQRINIQTHLNHSDLSHSDLIHLDLNDLNLKSLDDPSLNDAKFEDMLCKNNQSEDLALKSIACKNSESQVLEIFKREDVEINDAESDTIDLQIEAHSLKLNNSVEVALKPGLKRLVQDDSIAGDIDNVAVNCGDMSVAVGVSRDRSQASRSKLFTEPLQQRTIPEIEVLTIANNQTECFKQQEVAPESFQHIKHDMDLRPAERESKPYERLSERAENNWSSDSFNHQHNDQSDHANGSESKRQNFKTDCADKIQKKKSKQKVAQPIESRLNPWALMMIFSLLLFVAFAYLGFQQYRQHKEEQAAKSRYYLLEQQNAIAEQRKKMGKLSDTPIIPEKARKELLGNDLNE